MLITKQPTSNTTPDPAQGGAAVTGNTNTGHGDTTVVGGGVQTKTCIWTGFAAAPAGAIVSVTLKVGWSESGAPNTGNNQFKVEYSLNGGSTWANTLFDHGNVNAVNSGTAQASLSVGQDLTQVQVRDFLNAAVDANLTGAISNIRIEVTTQDQQVIVMM